MQRSVLVATSLVLVLTACYVEREPPPSSASNPPSANTTAQPTATYAQPTATTQPTYAPQPTATYAPQPTATAAPQPTSTVATPTPTFPPPGTTTPGALPPGLVIPNVCIPIGTWTKQFDNGLPATGTVQISAPVMFNQFPVTDGVVVANAPIGTLRGNGAMTSTNDLSVDVSNGAILASYTCKFTGSNCNQGTCTMTKGGVGGFKLVKK